MNDRRRAVGMAVAFSVAQNVGMLGDPDDNGPLFQECMIEIDRLMIMTEEGKGTRRVLAPYASISAHAIQRLLQREAVSSDTLETDVKKLLFLVEHVSHQFAASGVIDGLAGKSVFIPFREGAIVAAFAPFKTEATKLLQSSSGQRLCVRTYLPPHMLSEKDNRRMRLLTPGTCRPEALPDARTYFLSSGRNG